MDDLDALAGLLVDSATGGDGEALPGIFEAQRRDMDRQAEAVSTQQHLDVTLSAESAPQQGSLHIAKSVSSLLSSQSQTRRRRLPVTSTFALAVNQYLTRHPAFSLSQNVTFTLQDLSIEYKDLLEDSEGELLRDTVMDVQRHRVLIGQFQETLEIERLSAVYDSPAAALEAMLSPLQELAEGSKAPCPLYFDRSCEANLTVKSIPAGYDEPDISLITPSGLATAVLRNTLGRATYYILRGPLYNPKVQLGLGFLECKVRSRIDELPFLTEEGTDDESTERLVIRRTLSTATTSALWLVSAQRIARDVYDRSAWHSLLDCIKDMPIHTVRHIWQAFCFYFPTCGPYITHYVIMEMQALEGSGCSGRIGQGNIKLEKENGIRDGTDRDEAETKLKAILRLANAFARHLAKCRCTGLFTAYFKFIHEFIPLSDKTLGACYISALTDFVGNHPTSNNLWLQYISWGGRKAMDPGAWARKLYHRALSIPLEGRDRILELYDNFEKEKLGGGSFRMDDKLDKTVKQAGTSFTELGPLWRRINLVDFEPCPFSNSETLLQAQCRFGRFDATDGVVANYLAENDDHAADWDSILDDLYSRPTLPLPPGHAVSQASTWTGYPGGRRKNKPKPFSIQEDAELWAAWNSLLKEELPDEDRGASAHFAALSGQLYTRRCIEVLWKRIANFPFHVEAWLDLVKYILSATGLPLKQQELEARRALEAAREVLPDNLLLTCEFADYLRRGRQLADDDRGHALFWGLAERAVKKISLFQSCVPLVSDLGKDFVVFRAAMKRSQHTLHSLLGTSVTDAQYEAAASQLNAEVATMAAEFDSHPLEVLGFLSESDWLEHSRNVLIARQQAAVSLSLFTSLTTIYAQWMQWARQAHGVYEGAFHVRLVARHAIHDSCLLAAIMGEVRRLYKAFSIPFSTSTAAPQHAQLSDRMQSVWKAANLDQVCNAPSADQQIAVNPSTFEVLSAPQRCPMLPVASPTDRVRAIAAGIYASSTAPIEANVALDADGDIHMLFQSEIGGLSGVGEHDGERDDAVDRPIIFTPKFHLGLFSAYCSTWSSIETCFSQAPEVAVEVIRGWFTTIKRLFESTRDRRWTAMECGIDRSFFAACEDAWRAAPAVVGTDILTILTDMLAMLRADQQTDTYVEEKWCSALSYRIHVSGEASTPGQSLIKEHFATLVESLCILQESSNATMKGEGAAEGEEDSLTAEEKQELVTSIETSRNMIKSVASVDPLGAMLAFLGTPTVATSKAASAVDVSERVRMYASMWGGGGFASVSGGCESLSPSNASAFTSNILQGRQVFTSESIDGVRIPSSSCYRPTVLSTLREVVTDYQNAIDRSLTSTTLTPFTRVDHTIVASAKTALVNAHFNRTAATVVDQQRELLLASGIPELRRCAALQTSRHGIKGSVAWYQGGHHRSFGWPSRLHDRILEEDAASGILSPTTAAEVTMGGVDGMTTFSSASTPANTSLQSLVYLRGAIDTDKPQVTIYKDGGGVEGPEQRGDETYDELVSTFKVCPVSAVAGVEDLLGHSLRRYDPVDPTRTQLNMTTSSQLMQLEMLQGTCSLIAADELAGSGGGSKAVIDIGRSFTSRFDSQVKKAELLSMLAGTNIFDSRSVTEVDDGGANVYAAGQWVDFEIPVNERLQARQKKLLRQHTARGRGGGGDRGGRGGRGGRGMGMQAGIARGQSLLALANEEEHMRIKSRSKHLRRKATKGSNDFEDILLSSSDSSNSSESDSDRDDEFVLQQMRMQGYDDVSLASDAMRAGDAPKFSRHRVSTCDMAGVRSLEYAIDSVSLLLITKQEEVEREEQAARVKQREQQKKRVVDREDFVELGSDARKAAPHQVNPTLDSQNNFRSGQSLTHAPRDSASAQEALRSRAERTVARAIAKDLEAGKASPGRAAIEAMVADALQHLQDQAAEADIQEKLQERNFRGGRGGRGGSGQGRGGGEGGGFTGRGGSNKASLTSAGRSRRRVADAMTTKDYPISDVWAPVWVSATQSIYEDGFYCETSAIDQEELLASATAATASSTPPWKPLCLGEKRGREGEEDNGTVDVTAPVTQVGGDSSSSSFAKVTSVVPTRLNSDFSNVNTLRGNTPLSPVHFLATLLPLHTFENELVNDALANIAASKLIYGYGRNIKMTQGGGGGRTAVGDVSEGDSHCFENARLRTDVLVKILRDSPSFLVSTDDVTDGGM